MAHLKKKTQQQNQTKTKKPPGVITIAKYQTLHMAVFLGRLAAPWSSAAISRSVPAVLGARSREGRGAGGGGTVCSPWKRL